MRDLASRIRILLDEGADGVRVELEYARPLTAARLFAGRDAEAVVRLLPTLYSLCATAQAVACAEAIEQARGRGPGRGRVWRARARAIAAETVREHLWRILLDWPRALAEPPDEAAMARAAALCGRWRAALAGDGALLRPGGADGPDPAGPAADMAREALAGLVAERVLGCEPSRWLAEVGDRAALAAWCGRAATPAARLLGSLVATGRGGLGRCTVPPLCRPTPRALAARLAERGEQFAAAPTWAGQPHETSPFTRNLAAPLITDLVAAFGNGLVSRLAAQLVEVARLVAPTPRDEGALTEPALEPALDPGTGVGLVEAARGLLAHRVVLAGEQVVDYAILSPTDWNFHPQGVVAQGLAALCEEAGGVVEPLARLFVIAVDPCVAFDLVRRDDPGAQPPTAPLTPLLTPLLTEES